MRFVAATSGRTSLVANVVTPDGAATLDFVDTHLAHPGVVGVEIVPMGRVLKRSSSYGG